MTKKNIFNINSEHSFVDALADGIMLRSLSNPLDMTKMLVLLPNRRSCRNLKEALLRKARGRAYILPTIRAVGDNDDNEIIFPELDLDNSISATRRLFLLTQHVHEQVKGRFNFNQSMNFAQQLGEFLDDMQRHEISLDCINDTIPEELTEQWQQTFDLLNILSNKWPETLEQEGAMDVVDLRNKTIRSQANLFSKMPKDNYIIAAGSTGSTPATRYLLEKVAELENGQVVLPGLDSEMDDEDWDHLEEHHPQFLFKEMLLSWGVSRLEVPKWTHALSPSCDKPRKEIIRESMRPSATIANWMRANLPESVLSNVSMITASSIAEEAMVIAMMMREKVDMSKKTVALVTNDRNLARRVSALLECWNITVDDSAGKPIIETDIGVFFQLVIDVLSSDISPISLLSLLKHKFCLCGYQKHEINILISQIEIEVLRGPRIENGFAGIKEVLASKKLDEAAELVEYLQVSSSEMKALIQSPSARLLDLLQAHILLIEKLTKSGEGFLIWNNDDSSESLYSLFEDICKSSKGIETDPSFYHSIMKTLMLKKLVWPKEDSNSRLKILSPMEARLRHYDLMILGELNKGGWPSEISTGWMSRQMLSAFGLPPMEIMLGLSAHDFTNFMCAPEVVLIRSQKVEGAPSVPSAFWLRLETVSLASGIMNLTSPEKPWLEWARLINTPDTYVDMPPVAPVPAIEVRPRSLSVTQIERLMRDPYSIYASKILGLKPLKKIDEEPSVALFGSIIHSAFESFIKHHVNGTYDDLIECGKGVFSAFQSTPSVIALWWPRFEVVAEWFFMENKRRQDEGGIFFSEISGELSWESSGGRFTLKSRADRIELLADGLVNVIDYKTGTLPNQKDINSGLSPQISLEGLILEKGGFAEVSGVVADMEYWYMNIGDGLGKKQRVKVLISEVEDGVKNLIDKFDYESTPYLACPDSKNAPRYNDYEHLERVKEINE